jgi:tetratricopeptide (TPR) repeat protein
MRTLSIVSVGLLLLAAWTTPGGAWGAGGPEDSYYQGVAEGVQGNFALAREAFKDALASDPFYGPAIFGLETLNDVRNRVIKPETAVHLFKAMDLGNYARWEEYLGEIDQALKLDPHYVPSYIHRGNAHQELGQHEWAVSDYDQALKINPRSPAAYFNRGVAYGRMREWERAITDYDQALRIKPRFAQAYYARGNAHRKMGALALALADYQKALKINPRFAEAYFNQALALEQVGRDQEAAAAFRSFLDYASLEYENKIQYARERLTVLDKSPIITPFRVMWIKDLLPA